MNARRTGCVCKHTCFVLFRVLGLADLAFFNQRRCVLTPDQVRSSVAFAEGRAEVDADAMRPLSQRARARETSRLGREVVRSRQARRHHSFIWSAVEDTDDDDEDEDDDDEQRVDVERSRGSVTTDPDDFLRSKRALTEEDNECPVCYDVLYVEKKVVSGTVSSSTDRTTYREREPHHELRWCPCCKNAVHLGCVKKWLAHAARPTCVMCRSSAWSAWDGR